MLSWVPSAVGVAPVDVPIDVELGSDHTCLLLPVGNVECYGNNTGGQAISYKAGDAVRVSAGGATTCVLVVAGDIHCWGYNHAWSRTGLGAIALDTSWGLTCALVRDGNVTCFTSNHIPDLGYSGGDALSVSVYWNTVCVVTTRLETWCGNGFPAHPSEQGELIDVRVSSDPYGTGNPSTCTLSLRGNVHCVVLNRPSFHHLGGDAVAVERGDAATCILLQGGEAKCHLTCGHCGIPQEFEDAVDISVGARHVCVLRTSRDVICYGPDSGHGETQPFGAPLGRVRSDNTIHAGRSLAVRVQVDVEVSTGRLSHVYADSVTRYEAAVNAATRGDLLPLLREITVPPVLARIYGEDGMIRVVSNWAPTKPGCYGIQNHSGAFAEPLQVCSQFLP